MLDLPIRVVLLATFALLSSCATAPSAQSLTYWTSSSLDGSSFREIVDRVDLRMQRSALFVHDIDGDMHISIGADARAQNGTLGFPVTISLSEEAKGRRAPAYGRSLDAFTVRCQADNLDSCAENIVAHAERQARRIAHILAAAPRAQRLDIST